MNSIRIILIIYFIRFVYSIPDIESLVDRIKVFVLINGHNSVTVKVTGDLNKFKAIKKGRLTIRVTVRSRTYHLCQYTVSIQGTGESRRISL